MEIRLYLYCLQFYESNTDYTSFGVFLTEKKKMIFFEANIEHKSYTRFNGESTHRQNTLSGMDASLQVKMHLKTFLKSGCLVA